MQGTSAAAQRAGIASTSYSVAHSLPARVRYARRDRRRVASASSAAPAAPHLPEDVGAAKAALLAAIEYTRRGSSTDKNVRGQVEEAQCDVEALSGQELDYSLLEGKWRLIYTTAPDVLPILGLDTLQLPRGFPPNPVRIGDIYQRFSSVEEGRVENIITFGLEPFLQTATLTVGAGYEVRSPKRIALTFLEASVGGLAVTPAGEALLAPALLPRGDWNMRLLQGVRELELNFPFRSAQQVAAGRAVGASYLLTYLDDSMLIGRASGPTGTFILLREGAGWGQGNAGL